VDGAYQEYQRAGDDKDKRDDQNRSIEGWVRPEARFTFDVQVTNLSSVELGAVLWLLDLGKDGQHFFRLGGGKPLGFGSVRLERIGGSLATGEALAQYYGAFDPGAFPDEDAGRLDEAVNSFEEAIAAAHGAGNFAAVPFIQDFLKAAEGFADDLPIHYPRETSEPSPAGENFKWFQKNARGPKEALPPLAADRGLPLYGDGQFRRR
jgi:hypothetical protein